VLRGARPKPRGWWIWRALWIACALAAYGAIIALGWPLLEQRALAANASEAHGSQALPALMQAGLTFAAFALVACVALAVCWRKKRFGRIAVLLTPLAMLAIPEAARLLPGPWIWLACPVFGVIAAVLIAGDGRTSRREY
jgi:hypothetical protein